VQLAQLQALIVFIPGNRVVIIHYICFWVNQELVAESSLPVFGNQTLAIPVTANHFTDQTVSVDQNSFQRPVPGNACYGVS